MVSLDVATLSVPDYEIISRLEALLRNRRDTPSHQRAPGCHGSQVCEGIHSRGAPYWIGPLALVQEETRLPHQDWKPQEILKS